MNYWRIVAGHRNPSEPDNAKSVLLGDWLRKNYVAMGHPRSHPLHKIFRNDVKRDDKIVVVNDGYLWALGTITSDMKPVNVPQGSYLYPDRREVVWSKITRIWYRDFPKTLRNKMAYPKAINRLKREDWETLLMFV